jgi:hypothetical protein
MHLVCECSPAATSQLGLTRPLAGLSHEENLGSSHEALDSLLLAGNVRSDPGPTGGGVMSLPADGSRCWHDRRSHGREDRHQCARPKPV